MATLDNVTAGGRSASSMKKYGRYGDSEMAHVTPGEVVVPHSAQTPDVIAALQSRFNEIGVPMERYVVRSTKNSKNPKTGKGEYFLKKLVKAAAPIVGGAIGGPAGAAVGSAIGGAIGGEGGAGTVAVGGGGAYPVESNPLIQPVKAIAQGAASVGGLAQVTPYQVSSGDENRSPVLAGDVLEALDFVPAAAGSLSGMGVRPVQGMVRRINPETGMGEFFDEDRTSSMNPYTDKQEFADKPQNNAQQIAYNLGYRGPFGAGQAGAWLESNPQAHAQFAQIINSQPSGWGATPLQSSAQASTPAPQPQPQPQPNNYGWTGSSTNANDWLVENFNNIPANVRDQAIAILAQIPVAEGEGRRSQALAQNPGLNQQITNQFKQLGLQVGTGGNTYVPPATAPNAPPPANANQTAAWVNPNGGAQGGGSTAPAAAQEHIIGLYETGYNGQRRVMTNTGKFYDVKQNPYTGEIEYAPADSLTGYRQAATAPNIGEYNYGNNKTATSFRFGNDAHKQVVNIGDSFSYKDPNAPAQETTPSTTSAYNTPNGQLYGNEGIPTGTPTYSNTQTPTTQQENQQTQTNTQNQQTNDYNDYFAQQQQQYESWMKSMEDRLASFAAQNANTGADTGGGATDTAANDNSGSSGVGNTVDNLSTLSPRRGPRFRSSRAVGTRASGF